MARTRTRRRPLAAALIGAIFATVAANQGRPPRDELINRPPSPFECRYEDGECPPHDRSDPPRGPPAQSA